MTRSALIAIPAGLILAAVAAGCSGGLDAKPTATIQVATRQATSAVAQTSAASPTASPTGSGSTATAPAAATTAVATAAATATATPPAAAQPTQPTATPPPAPPGPVTLNVAMHDNFYAPLTLAIKPGQQVTVVVKNEGLAIHNFAVVNPNDTSAQHPESPLLKPGEQATVTFSIAEPGTYTYHCDVHVKEQMVGTIIVQ